MLLRADTKTSCSVFERENSHHEFSVGSLDLSMKTLQYLTLFFTSVYISGSIRCDSYALVISSTINM